MASNIKEHFDRIRQNIVAMRAIKAVLVFLVLLFAFFIRIDTFWLPHLSGDQAHYLGLAMKLDNYGFKEGFNLRGIRQTFMDLDEEGHIRLAAMVPAEDPDETGDILGMMRMWGIEYYDQPFFHKPPGFPYMLMISHRLFAEPGQPYSVVASNLGPDAARIRPNVFFRAQFYAVIVPLAFGLGAILLTFFLGKRLFSYRVGLYAALLFAAHPVVILTDQRLFSDSMVAFFVILAAYLFFMAREKDWDWFYLFSGISCGAAVLAKQTGGYFLIAILAFTVLAHENDLWDVKKLPRILTNRAFVLTAAGVFLVSGFWFLKIYRLFGDPLWLPRRAAGPGAESGWSEVIGQRPQGYVLYLVGVPYLGPPLIAAYLSLKEFASESWNMLKKKAFDHRFVLLWMMILVFGFMLREGREHRRMTAVYPFIAILASYYYEKFINYDGRFSRYLGNRYLREGAVLLFFAVSLLWMVHMGKQAMWARTPLIMVPF